MVTILAVDFYAVGVAVTPNLLNLIPLWGVAAAAGVFSALCPLGFFLTPAGKQARKTWNKTFVARAMQNKLTCAKCGKIILPGEPYVVAYITHEVTCKKCSD
jgi:hypothetical protein